MTKKEIIGEFCVLASTVSAHFNYEYPTDCFCQSDPYPPAEEHYQFSRKILTFIERAVEEKIERG